MNDADIARYRALFPVLERVTYLNPGTYGPLSTRVADALREWTTMLELEGPYSPIAEQRGHEAYEATRAKLAALLGAEPSEIALTRSVTDGTNIVAHGLRWQPGDEIIVSDKEHESGWVNWQVAAQRHGATVKVLALTNDEEELLRRLEALLTPRTRIVFMSHVSCITGLRIPAARLAKLVHDRGALFMLDGAHGAGQIPVDVRALGCDFYTGCGHKWLMGPQGTGYLYIAKERLEEVEPVWVGWGSRAAGKGPGDAQLVWAEGNRRFECATRLWGIYAALGVAVDLIQEVGVGNIETRVRELVGPFKRELAALPGMELQTPHAPHLSAGLVRLNFRGYDHDQLARRYEDQRMLFQYSRFEDGAQTIRFAVAYFMRPEELQRALDFLRRCAP